MKKKKSKNDVRRTPASKKVLKGGHVKRDARRPNDTAPERPNANGAITPELGNAETDRPGLSQVFMPTQGENLQCTVFDSKGRRIRLKVKEVIVRVR